MFPQEVNRRNRLILKLKNPGQNRISTTNWKATGHKVQNQNHGKGSEKAFELIST